MRTIRLPVYEIVVQLDNDGGGSIECNDILLDNGDINSSPYSAGISAILNMVLDHACAGVDISTPAYLQGLETAIDVVVNEYDK